VDPEAEAGGLPADEAAALAVVNCGKDGGLPRFKLGEPPHQRLARAGSVEVARRTETNAHAFAELSPRVTIGDRDTLGEGRAFFDGVRVAVT
jgi:hypothetical protein